MDDIEMTKSKTLLIHMAAFYEDLLVNIRAKQISLNMKSDFKKLRACAAKADIGEDCKHLILDRLDDLQSLIDVTGTLTLQQERMMSEDISHQIGMIYLNNGRKVFPCSRELFGYLLSIR